MNLTLDARLINTSGIGVYLQNVLQSERLLKYDLRILYKADEKDFFKTIGEKAKMVEYNASLYSIKELLQTPATTKHTDIFWSPHFNVPLINFASKLKVVTIHDVFHLAHYHTLTMAQKLYAALMYKKAVTDSDIIFTVSHQSKKEIINYTKAKADKIKVVYNGIDYVKFNTILNEEEKKAVTNKYDIHFPFLLFVGNVKPHKNLHNALLGFKNYLLENKKEASAIKFVIVGKREGFITGDNKINDIVQDPVLKDRVHFTGWVLHEHLAALYQQAQAFIFPSFYEGFGFPPLEAMAAGCPVISSNASCMPEVYGDAALFFNPANPIEIGAAIHQILTDHICKKELIQKGLIQSKKYNWHESINTKMNWIETMCPISVS